MTELVSLTEEQWKGDSYRHLLPPLAAVRHHLKASFICFTAIEQGTPVGIIIGHYLMRGYELDYFFVLPSYRRRGIGALLLKQFIKTLTDQGELIFIAALEQDHPDAKVFQKLFSGDGWYPPKPLIERSYHDVIRFNPPWFNRTPKLPPDIEELPWEELSSTELAQVEHAVNQGAIPRSISPLYHDRGRIEPLNSLALRHQSKVIGWIVTHRVELDTIRYSSLYLDAPFRHLGLSIRLVVDAIQKHQNSPIKWGYYEIIPQAVSPSWLGFVRRRIRPYGQKSTLVDRIWKKLQPD